MIQPVDPHNFNFLVLDIARLVRAEFDRRINKSGLGVTSAEGRVLAHLARSGPLRQNVLADLLGVAAMSLTGFVDRLEAAGLVERRPDPDDRRAKQVHLTPAAEPVLEEIITIGASIRAIAAGPMDSEEWEVLRSTLRAVHERLRAETSGYSGKDVS